ncbi:DUF916 and DUF3324 domain-containing protein [Enterococcus faecalis]|uniref:DUF916 and DUF3324 domain-containing protein n=1 Tax=Enterococcus faecalis TaxID=1351 RepID=UPI002090DC8B|nr:DUF916 and DUF3324 domain-containing protein [Enterococcus faecalis]MCO5446233.1 DUF916 and DUF3324 domain-containing protein [Enterococcus faecalis]
MKHNKHLKFVLVLACTLLPFLLGQKISAEENNSQVGFSVSPNYNEAQNKESSFFDLLVQPNSKQTISITVTNTSKDDSNYIVKAIQASTNKNGVIDYTDSKAEPLRSVPFELNKQASYEEKIKLSAGETKQVPITLSIPDKPFKGEILGGVNVTKEIPKQDKTPQLVNRYSYVIGLRIREGKENSERELSAGEVKPVVSFGKPGITVPISNDQANTMGKLMVESVLKREEKEIKKDTYKDREIAPNSVYPYSLSWDKQDYVPGNYQLSIVVTDAQSHKWIFEKEFTLKAEELTKIKEAAVHPPKEQNLWLWGLIGLFVLIIFLLLVYIFLTHKKKKRKKDTNA